MKQNKSRFMPLIMAVCVVIGILIGTFYANHFSGNRLSIINSSSNKLNSLLHIIDDKYVDTVNINDIVEKAMPQILSELDPHSVYIAARDMEIANDELKVLSQVSVSSLRFVRIRFMYRMSSAMVLLSVQDCWLAIRL